MLLKFHEWCAQMSSKDVGHVVHNSRPTVKGFAEFRCSPVRGEDTEASESIQKVNCTKLQYTYPVRTSIECLAFFKSNYNIIFLFCKHHAGKVTSMWQFTRHYHVI